MTLFRDRREAGRRLGAALRDLRGPGTVVLGLPRGGVPVGLEVARALGAPLDVLIARKLGVPFREELAMGAIAGSAVVRNEPVIRELGIPEEAVIAAIARERKEAARREERYRGGRAAEPVAGKTVVLVDDGLATGTTAWAAIEALRVQEPARIVLAVPVGAADSVRRLEAATGAEVRCLEQPAWFRAVGEAYGDFLPTSDEEVIACLQDATRAGAR